MFQIQFTHSPLQMFNDMHVLTIKYCFETAQVEHIPSWLIRLEINTFS